MRRRLAVRYRMRPVLAPKRLEQAGGAEAGIERLLDAVLFEDLRGDERQLLNGFAKFGGYVFCSRSRTTLMGSAAAGILSPHQAA
jgi:hypothetical protein